MDPQTNVRFVIREIAPDVKVIVGGKDLIKEKAIRLAFPNAPDIESFGFKIQGNDLQIRKYNFNAY